MNTERGIKSVDEDMKGKRYTAMQRGPEKQGMRCQMECWKQKRVCTPPGGGGNLAAAVDGSHTRLCEAICLSDPGHERRRERTYRHSIFPPLVSS